MCIKNKNISDCFNPIFYERNIHSELRQNIILHVGGSHLIANSTPDTNSLYKNRFW